MCRGTRRTCLLDTCTGAACLTRRHAKAHLPPNSCICWYRTRDHSLVSDRAHLLGDSVENTRGAAKAPAGLHGRVLTRHLPELLEVAAQAVVKAVLGLHMLHAVRLGVRLAASLQDASTTCNLARRVQSACSMFKSDYFTTAGFVDSSEGRPHLKEQPGSFQLFLELAAEPSLVVPERVVQMDSRAAVATHIIHPLLCRCVKLSAD